MATKTFKVGKVQIDGDDLDSVDNATLNIVFDSAEDTEIGDTWKTMLSLAKSWNISVTCKYNPADTAQSDMITEMLDGDGAIADIRAYEDGAVYYHGACVITAFNITKAINAIDTLSMTFEGNGALTRH